MRNQDLSKFHIGVYCWGHRTEESVKQMKDAGIDVIMDGGICTDEQLSWLEKYKMGIIYDGAWRAAVDGRIKRSPAVWGIGYDDEPMGCKYEECQQAFQVIREKYPEVTCYVNLNPTGNWDGLKYDEYIKSFVEKVDSEMISYDHYPMKQNDMHDSPDYPKDGRYIPGVFSMWYDNFDFVAEECRKSGRDFWMIIQCNNNVPDVPAGGLSRAAMSYQMYTSLAYGATHVSWACWNRGWFNHNIATDDGTLNKEYYKVQSVNREIWGIADAYMAYKNIATHYVGFAEHTDAYKELHSETIYDYTPNLFGQPSFSNGVFQNLTAEEDNSVLVGEMVSRGADSKNCALLLSDATSAKLMHDDYSVSFAVAGNPVVKAHCGDVVTTLHPDDAGLYHVTMKACSGMLVTAEF